MNFAPKNQVVADVGRYVSRTEFITDPDNEEQVVAVHNMQFDGLVDLVGQMRNEGIHGSKEMRLVAVFPPGLPEKCCQMWGISWAEFWSDKKWIKRMLNDPDLAAFRVAPGRV